VRYEDIDAHWQPDAAPWPLVLDGGLSNVLEELGCDLHPTLWTAGLIDSNPRAIVEAHLAYLRAGADIITTASYQASLPGFIEAGYTAEQGHALLRRSVELAKQAVERFQVGHTEGRRRILVAASVGPYGAYLADGSEYTGSYAASDAQLREFHAPRLRELAESGVDVLAVETQPSLREVGVLAELLSDVDVPAWVSFCCVDGGHLRDGTALAEAVALVRDLPTVFAVGVNCTAPAWIGDIVRLLRREAPRQRIVVYPNSGEVYEPNTGRWLGTSAAGDIGQLVAAWIADGADIIGGCCRFGPEQIRGIRDAVIAARYDPRV
jgi:homocysteine S-methyltransferase